MPSRGDRLGVPLAAVALLTLVGTEGCDLSESDATGAPLAEPTDPLPSSSRRLQNPAEEGMVYENDEDRAILADTSNLRPPTMSELEHRMSLQQDAREELRRNLPDVSYPTQDDVAQLALRWFAQGAGVVAQNHSEHGFSLAVHFTSSEDSSCRATVPWREVAPAASAMFTPKHLECEVDRAQVTINDEYGFLAGFATPETTGDAS